MGISGISLWQLLIVLLIVVLIFGTKKLRSMGGDLGSAVRSFRSAMSGDSRDDDGDDDTRASGGKLPGASGEQGDAGKQTRVDADFDEELQKDKDRDAMHR